MDIRQAILDATDLKTEAVTVPEWGGITVHVGAMNGHDRTQWNDAAFDADGKAMPNGWATLLAHCLRDDAGNRIFTTADAEALQAKNGATLAKLFVIARRINGLAPGEQETAEKN